MHVVQHAIQQQPRARSAERYLPMGGRSGKRDSRARSAGHSSRHPRAEPQPLAKQASIMQFGICCLFRCTNHLHISPKGSYYQVAHLASIVRARRPPCWHRRQTCHRPLLELTQVHDHAPAVSLPCLLAYVRGFQQEGLLSHSCCPGHGLLIYMRGFQEGLLSYSCCPGKGRPGGRAAVRLHGPAPPQEAWAAHRPAGPGDKGVGPAQPDAALGCRQELAWAAD